MNSPVYTKTKGFFSTFFVVWLMVGGPPNQQLSPPVKALPSRELTYPLQKAVLKMILLFPRWDMLVSWRVTHSVVLRA